LAADGLIQAIRRWRLSTVRLSLTVSRHAQWADRTKKITFLIAPCFAKSKPIRCGYDRLSLSTRFAMRNVERADAGIYPDHAPGILTFFNATPISLVPLYRTRVKIALF